MIEPVWKSMTWHPPVEVIIQTFDMARVRLELSKRNWYIDPAHGMTQRHS